MENQKETKEIQKDPAIQADQETLARSVQEDERQDLLDEKVADALQELDAGAAPVGEEKPEEPADAEPALQTADSDPEPQTVAPEIIQQTIDAEESQETLDTRVLRDFDEGILTIDRVGVIR